jgi:CBS domain containing-hemolysin-like protein
MVALDQNTSLGNAVRLSQNMHFHDIPVYQNNISNIVGILSLEPWEVLELDLEQKTLLQVIKPALYVTENQYLEELFHLFDQQNCNTAIVVDEFGSTTGIIDKQDLYEEVVGDLESSPEESSRRRYNQKMLFQELGQDCYMIDAKLPIAEVNDILGININASEFYSLGGFMLSHLHHLPKTGESINECGYSFIIHSMTARAIKTIKVERLVN